MMLRRSKHSEVTRFSFHHALLAHEAELRIRAPESFLRELSGAAGKWRSPHRDARLPAEGTWLNRQFKQQNVAVEVLEKGFRYQERGALSHAFNQREPPA